MSGHREGVLGCRRLGLARGGARLQGVGEQHVHPALERRDRARHAAPERVFFFAKTAPVRGWPRPVVLAHERGCGFGLAAGCACWRGAGANFFSPPFWSAETFLPGSLPLPPLASFFAALPVSFAATGGGGFTGGSGMRLPASTRSSSRGNSIVNLPW